MTAIARTAAAPFSFLQLFFSLPVRPGSQNRRSVFIYFSLDFSLCFFLPFNSLLVPRFHFAFLSMLFRFRFLFPCFFILLYIHLWFRFSSLFLLFIVRLSLCPSFISSFAIPYFSLFLRSVVIYSFLLCAIRSFIPFLVCSILLFTFSSLIFSFVYSFLPTSLLPPYIHFVFLPSFSSLSQLF